MRHNLQVLLLALLACLIIEWGYLDWHWILGKLQCIESSYDRWEFLPFFLGYRQSLRKIACCWGCARRLQKSLGQPASTHRCCSLPKAVSITNSTKNYTHASWDVMHRISPADHPFSQTMLQTNEKIRQDRRWNADKPSAALDPYIPTWLTTSPANHRPANFWIFFLNIGRKLWKVVQSQVELMKTNSKFEAPILWFFKYK